MENNNSKTPQKTLCKPHQNGCECCQDVTENVKYKGHVLLRKEGDPGGCKETQAEMPQKFTKGQVRNCGTWHEKCAQKEGNEKGGETLRR